MDFNPKAAGRVIRQLRKKHKLSQDVLSGLVGTPRSHLSKIETGNIQPNFETIWRFAIALNYQPDELVAMIMEETKRMEKEKETQKKEN